MARKKKNAPKYVEYDDNCYLGSWQFSRGLADLLEACGIVITEKLLNKVAKKAEGVLYVKALQQAPEEFALAVRGEQALQGALKGYRVSQDTIAAYDIWQALVDAAEQETVAINDAKRQALELLQNAGLSDVDINAIAINVSTVAIERAEEARTDWLNAVRADFDTRMKSIKDNELRKYVKEHVRGVQGDPDTGSLDRDNIRVPLPTKAAKKSTKSTKGGNSGAKKTWVIPSAVKFNGRTIALSGNWHDIAKILNAEGLLSATATGFRWPSHRNILVNLKGAEGLVVHYDGIGEYTPHAILTDEHVSDMLQK